MEHNEAPAFNLFDPMVSILAGLHNLVLIEMLVESVNGLFRPVIPACVDPILTGRIRPRFEYLCHDGLIQVIWIANMNPITDSPPLSLVVDKIQW